MKIFTPEYYKHFSCIAAACPDSCCKEWQVDVDETSAVFYRNLPGSLGQRLREVLYDDDGCTVMRNIGNRCPMWRQDGLCEIQAQLGHNALCQTCREFPRLSHDYGNFLERDLELSCPEAAKLIFANPFPKILCERTSGDSQADYEPEIMDILLRSRDIALSFLAERAYPLRESLAILLLFAHDVQSAIDGDSFPVFDPEQLLSEAKKYLQNSNALSVLSFFKNLEILTPLWKNRLDAGCVSNKITEDAIPLVTYCIRRYWLQAISDYDLICRMKFILIACILVSTMGGDLQETAQKFSKEIENNPDNVDAILDAAYTCPAFTDVHLISLLLNQ